ncbi:MAG: ABC transporter ATP-binding protein [Chloroflexi bacterium]|nr:ABC transporter ATP-binding protein [Chloroflexota bacterium]
MPRPPARPRPTEAATVWPPLAPSATDATAQPAVPAQASRRLALYCEGVTKVYRGPRPVQALRGVSLQVAEGEFVALMGPSGSGKSTLLHILGGIDTPTGGRVVLDGVDLGTLDAEALTRLRRERTGFVFQFFNLLPTLTVWENVDLPFALGAAHNGYRAERVHHNLARMGLLGYEQHTPQELSGGEQQRVAIARALVTRPAIVFADEPTGNLDYATSAEILQLLRTCAREYGQTIVLVTHSAAAAAYADRVLLVRDGQIHDEIVLGRREDHSATALIARLAELGL